MANGGQSIEVQLDIILSDFEKEVRDDVSRAFELVGTKTAAKLRATSPKRSGEYAKGWRKKSQGGAMGSKTVIVYNSKKPQLTHLLEHGHVTRNKRGTYGRTPAHVHIKPVEEQAKAEVVALVKRYIET